MQQQTFIIGSREFTCARMNPFEANRLLLRGQKLVMPVIGAIFGGSKGKASSIMDMDVKEAAMAIADNLDESIMDTIILPMFVDSKVYSNENKKFIKGPGEINQCFTTENLLDFYELIFEVARYQFGPFLDRLVERFGSLVEAPKSQGESQAS